MCWTLRTESPSIESKSFAGKQNKKSKEDLLQENSDYKPTTKHVSHSYTLANNNLHALHQMHHHLDQS